MSHLFRLRSAFVLGLLITIASNTRVIAQDATVPITNQRPTARIDFRINHKDLGNVTLLGMHSEANRLGIDGKPQVVPSERRFYYLPPISLVRTPKGIQGQIADDGTISLNVVWDRPEARRVFLEHLIEHKLVGENPTEGQIQLVSAKHMEIVTSPRYSPAVAFGPYENFTFSDRTGVLVAKLASKESAQRFLDDLSAQRLTLNASIVMEGYGFKQSTATLSFEEFRRTSKFKDLVSRDGRGISRSQLGEAVGEALIAKSLTIVSDYEDADFRQLVDELIRMLAGKDSPFQDIQGGWKGLDEFFEKHGWEPDSFRADVIRQANLEMNAEEARNFLEEMSNKQSNEGEGGGFSLGLFGLNILDLGKSGKNKDAHEKAKKVATHVLDKWGVKYVFDGEVIVPKQVAVLRNDFSSFQAQGSVTVGKRKMITADAVMSIEITPSSALHVVATEPLESRQAEIARLLAKLSERVAANEATINDLVRVSILEVNATDDNTYGRPGKADLTKDTGLNDKEWELLGHFPVIAGTGFFPKAVFAGKERDDHIAPPIAITHDKVTTDAAGNYVLEMNAQWSTWNHLEGVAHGWVPKARVVAVFMRKKR